MKSTSRRRPWGVVVACVLAGLTGLALTVLGVLSAFSGHGTFSGGVAGMLIVYGAGILAATWGLWRLHIFARGPIVATALLHLAVIFSGVIQAPQPWILLVVALIPAVTVVATLWPSTTAALRARPSAGHDLPEQEA